MTNRKCVSIHRISSRQQTQLLPEYRPKDSPQGQRLGNRGKKAIALFSLMGFSLLVSSCQHSKASLPPRTLTVKQNWELKPGHFIGGHLISGGLGDVSIEMNGKSVYAPFPGTLQSHSVRPTSKKADRSNASDSASSSSTPNKTPAIQCAIFSSPELPAYVLRLCGIQRPKFGELAPGDVMGKGQTLQFAALRKQPSGEWAIVEPASDILERILSKP